MPTHTSPHLSIMLAVSDLGDLSWLGLLGPLGLLAWAVHRTVPERQRQRLEPAEAALHELLKDDLDELVNRAVTDEDLVLLRKRRNNVERFARQNKKITQLGELVQAFAAVEGVPGPKDRADQARHQQQLGEAIGMLKAKAEAAYDEVVRRRTR